MAMTAVQLPFEIQSEARGGHWIAWVVRAGQTQPEGSIVLVGATREEAEARARDWINSPYFPTRS